MRTYRKGKSQPARQFSSLVFAWFRVNRRNLPWRRTRDPYRILVSEVMLQQTQVSRVMPKYRSFLQCFPTVRALAAATQADVIRAWSGLGYNRRALNLHRAAREIEDNLHGEIPRNVEMLEQLPGVGRYTARAVAAFAFNNDAPMVDTNIRRVLSRYFFGLHRQSDKRVHALAETIQPAGSSRDWGGALMDFGALVCTSRDPKCEACPLNKTCKAAPRIARLRAKGASLPAVKKSKGAFRESNRFYRGWIVDTLRARSLSKEELWRLLNRSYPTTSRQKYKRAFGELMDESLIEKVKSQYRLKR